MFISLPDKLVGKAVKTIMKINHTGKPGDGMIFVCPLLDVVRVRTGESGEEILDDA